MSEKKEGKRTKEKWKHRASWEEEGQIYNLYKWDAREFWKKKKRPPMRKRAKKLSENGNNADVSVENNV